MQATLIGVSRMAGIGKESKNPYDMCRALVLNPITDFRKGDFSRSGHGFEVVEIEVDLAALPQFARLKFPFSGSLQIDQAIRGGKMTSVVTGISQGQEKAAS